MGCGLDVRGVGYEGCEGCEGYELGVWVVWVVWVRGSVRLEL
jgi:hypothetical protein